MDVIPVRQTLFLNKKFYEKYILLVTKTDCLISTFVFCVWII